MKTLARHARNRELIKNNEETLSEDEEGGRWHKSEQSIVGTSMFYDTQTVQCSTHLGHDVVNARYLHVLVDCHIRPERRRRVTAVLHITRLSAPAREGTAPVVPNSKSLTYRF